MIKESWWAALVLALVSSWGCSSNNSPSTPHSSPTATPVLTPPALVRQWGGSGSGNGTFNLPLYIATDSTGNLYVTDFNNNLVQIFTNTGGFISQWSGGSTPGGIKVDASGYVYVAYPFSNVVAKTNGGGGAVTLWGTSGSGNGQMNTPNGLALDGSGDIFVADANNSRVDEFTTGGSYMAKFGTAGSANGQFGNSSIGPTDLVLSGGNLYVVDTANSRIEVFGYLYNPIFYISGWGYTGQWGSLGVLNGLFNSPQGIAADGSGNIYVADTWNNRVQKFDARGNYLAKWGSLGTGNGLFNHPTGITVDASGNIFVVDSGNNLIQEFH